MNPNNPQPQFTGIGQQPPQPTVMQQPQQQPIPVAQPVVATVPTTPYTAAETTNPPASPLFGFLSIILGGIGLLLIPILYVHASSYYLLLIAFAVGAAGFGLGVLALKQANNTPTLIVLTGIIVSLITISLSATQVLQNALFENKLHNISSPSSSLNLNDTDTSDGTTNLEELYKQYGIEPTEQ